MTIKTNSTNDRDIDKIDDQRNHNNSCRVCGYITTEWTHLRMASKYFYCNHCEFISKDETMRVTPDQAFNIYNTHKNDTDDQRYVSNLHKFLKEAVFPYSNGLKNGFDFGSGPDPVLSQLLTRDYGYEMDIYDLYYAPDRINFGKKYDLVTSTEVAEHIPDPLNYFRQLKSLLTDTGTLAIITQFHQNNSLHFSDWHYVRDKSHISFYTEKTMKTIAQKVGLKVVFTNRTQYATFVKDIRIEPVKVVEQIAAQDVEQVTEQAYEQVNEPNTEHVPDGYNEEKENDETENI